tara:strand:- start:7341 stop:7778 length:438 start_codon:yes stop_codon:yes gene_type:complete
MQDHTELMNRIKKHEGFVNKIYKDSLGKATIGFGHLITKYDKFEDGKEYSKEELEYVFKDDFNNALAHANSLMDGLNLHQETKNVIVEMVFQLGVGGVGKFKKMWEALRHQDYNKASKEMLDSRWAKQTPRRAEELSAIVRSCRL